MAATVLALDQRQLRVRIDHGGGVEYHSEVGKGTTVTVYLPAAETAGGTGAGGE